MLARQALLHGTVAEVCRIDSCDNPADGPSKPTFHRVKPSATLATALTTGTLDTPVRAATTSSTARNTPRPDLTFKPPS